MDQNDQAMRQKMTNIKATKYKVKPYAPTNSRFLKKNFTHGQFVCLVTIFNCEKTSQNAKKKRVKYLGKDTVCNVEPNTPTKSRFLKKFFYSWIVYLTGHNI